MITRIVKLHFHPDFCQSFESSFPEFKNLILSFNGCNDVKLQKTNTIGIYFTISIWEKEINLEQYRSSETFIKIWNTLKPNFTHPAEAWSTVEV